MNRNEDPARGICYAGACSLLLALAGCLCVTLFAGCTASGNYKYSLDGPFGKITYEAVVTPHEGEKESYVTFDNWFKKLIDSVVAPAEPVESSVTVIETTTPTPVTP